MDGKLVFFLEFFAFSGPVLAWCAWELWSLKRKRKKVAAERSA